MTFNLDDQGSLPLWTIELTLIPSTAATDPAVMEALRSIKARRRRGNPMTCCCCQTPLGAAPFTLVLGQGNDGAITRVESGLCRGCGPDLEAAGEKAAQIVRGIRPGMADYNLTLPKAALHVSPWQRLITIPARLDPACFQRLVVNAIL